ncbi:MAG: GTP cyclohydrolase II RibA [Acidobacteriota bacterium]
MDLRTFLHSQASFKTKKWGNITVESVSLTEAVDGDLAVYFGAPFSQLEPLVRIHSECVFGEIFGSELCDCAQQLEMALGRLKAEKHGILLYLRIDGRGAGLSAKVKATDLETQGIDTYDSRMQIGVAPEGRDFSRIGDFLKKKGVEAVRLMTNNPDKISGVSGAGIVVNTEPLVIDTSNPNIRQLYATKAKKFRHMIPRELQEIPEIGQYELDFTPPVPES